MSIPNNSAPEAAVSTPAADMMSVFDEPTVPAADGVDGNGSSQQQQQQQQQQIEIDPRFAGLPPDEGRYRTAQSRFDSLNSVHTKTVEELAIKSRAEEFLVELLEDDPTFEAFVAERRPELLQKRDLTSAIQTELEKEFGEGYKPDPDEIKIPGSKSWLYNRRADEVYTKLSGSSAGKATSVKELKERRTAEKKTQAAEAVAAVNEVKTAMKWDDPQIEEFHAWAKSLKPVQLAKMYAFAMRTAGVTAPNLANVAGRTASGKTAREQFLNDIY